MTFPWTDDLDPRQQQELDFARTYATRYAHGTDGHSRLMLIARLAEMLDAWSAATTTPLEQLITAATQTGAAGIWLLRGAASAALIWSDRDDTPVEAWASLLVTPPHEMIILIRLEVADGGVSGVEFRLTK